MTDIVADSRGPYLLECVANADNRRRDKEREWVGRLTVATHGEYAYGDVEYMDKTVCIVEFHPHEGDGEPKP
jgi:hypothetical protein